MRRAGSAPLLGLVLVDFAQLGAFGRLPLGHFLDAVLRPMIDTLPSPVMGLRRPTLPPRAHCQSLPGRPWQSLYFLPDPHGQGAFRDGLFPVAVAAPADPPLPAPAPPRLVWVPPSSVGPL